MLKLKVFNYQTGEFQETVLTPETKPQGGCLIGRTAGCDIVLESPDVSRVHARIEKQKDGYHFIDPGSANGSSINSQNAAANQSYPLKVDDLIRIGDFVLLVEAIETNPTGGETSVIMKRLEGDREWKKGNLTVRCVRITYETPDVKTFTFVAEPAVRFNYKPGQFVTLELEINGESVLRSYSISSPPSRSHTLEITVKRVPAPADALNLSPGVVSNWLHDTIKVGSQIKLSGPTGKFTCAPAAKLLMISAGSGITPMMSMSRWIADTAAETDVVFFHCARTPRDIIFRQELEMMSARLPNFHLAISTTQAELGHPWYGLTGRLTEDMLRCVAPDFQERLVYVCGPDGFMQATKSLLEGLGFPMQNYSQESFGAPKKSKPEKAESLKNQAPTPAPANGHASAQPLVVFSQSGKQATCDGSESILELAEQAGVKIRSNCKQGVCGACKKRKLEGEVRYDSEPDALEPSDQAAGYILACVASPIGRVVIEA
jgi:ferredoxin-NADP reductase